MMRRRRGFADVVRRTSAINALSAATAALTGIAIARWVGPSVRGQYATATSWYGITLVVFELGLAASIVFFVASDRGSRRTYVLTSLNMLAALGAITALITVVGAEIFIDARSPLRDASVAIAALVLVSFLGAPATFALQAINILAWNLVRFFQPATYFVLILLVSRFTSGGLTAVVLALLASVTLQTMLAWLIVWRDLGRQAGAFRCDVAGQMLRYGLPNMAATMPNSLNSRLDQLVLLALVPSAALGQYAVAVTLSLLPIPLTSAFGHVAFPSLADASGDASETVPRALRGAFRVAVIGVLAVVAAAPLLVPPLFGVGFENVPFLVLLLAPGAVLFMLNAVAADLLRGLGRPALVARAEWLGVGVTLLGLIFLVPKFGTTAAAITSSVAYGVVWSMMYLGIRRVSRDHPKSL